MSPTERAVQFHQGVATVIADDDTNQSFLGDYGLFARVSFAQGGLSKFWAS
jgi:hypothetical protein